MRIEYDAKEDTMLIHISDHPVVRDISYGWNVNVGMTANGIGQITILDAKQDGLLPIEIGKEMLSVVHT